MTEEFIAIVEQLNYEEIVQLQQSAISLLAEGAEPEQED